MAHELIIGEPIVEHRDYRKYSVLKPTVKPITTPEGEDPVHEDPYEWDPDKAMGRRCPSFTAWEHALRECDPLMFLWYDIRDYATQHYEPAYIPISEYISDIPEVENELLMKHEQYGSHTEEHAAVCRGLWFTRWSQYAYDQLWERAAFQSVEPLRYSHVPKSR